MIENPQVGQRVWWLDLYDGHSTAESGTVTAMDVEPEVSRDAAERGEYGNHIQEPMA